MPKRARPLQVGDACRAKFKVDKPPPLFTDKWQGRGSYFCGMIAGYHDDDQSFDVFFTDGFFEERILPQHVQRAHHRVLRQWRTTGHELIGRKVSREFQGGKRFKGEIKAWCAAAEDNSSDAMWHVVHSDDDEESLTYDQVISALIPLPSSRHSGKALAVQGEPQGSDAPSLFSEEPFPPLAHGMATVAHLLARFRLEAYTTAFEQSGYDDAGWMLRMSEENVDALVAHTRMKPGHAAKFRDYLAAVRKHYHVQRFA